MPPWKRDNQTIKNLLYLTYTMAPTNHRRNSTSPSHAPLSRSGEATRSAVDAIRYSFSRTPISHSRVAKRRRRLQIANMANQSGISPSVAQLPLVVAPSQNVHSQPMAQELQQSLNTDSTLDTHSTRRLQDNLNTNEGLEISPNIQQPLAFSRDRALCPISGGQISHRHEDRVVHE